MKLPNCSCYVPSHSSYFALPLQAQDSSDDPCNADGSVIPLPTPTR